MNKPPKGGLFISAEEEIRTPTPVTALPPQSSASTNFATAACGAGYEPGGYKYKGFFIMW